ncbi:MAG: hypothetical protein RL226_1281, partial [Bacteroidota bacterium]
LEGKPVFKVKGKTLIVSFEEALKSNVTYTFSFGDGVVDITERNPAENLTYVFSTGRELDSLQLSGSVLNEFTGEPVKGARVMLYRDDSDSLPLTTRPYYATRTNQEGLFNFTYLKAGNYKVFALLEDNSNYLYDDFSESFAFLDTLISLKADTTLGKLHMSTAQDTAQYLRSYRADETGFMRCALNLPLSASAQITPVNTSDSAAWYAEGDSLFIWWTSTPLTLVALQDRGMTDTVEFETPEALEQVLQVVQRAPVSARSEDSLRIRFSRPIAAFNDAQLLVSCDSLPLDARLESTSNPFEALIAFNRESGKEYRFTLNPGAVVSREGWMTDTLSWKTIMHRDDFLGTLNINMDLPEEIKEPRLVLLRNGEQISIQSVESGISAFDRLIPGTYTLFVFDDRNNNYQWDAGDYFRQLQPERIWHFKQAIEVRSNWILDIDYIFSE